MLDAGNNSSCSVLGKGVLRSAVDVRNRGCRSCRRCCEVVAEILSGLGRRAPGRILLFCFGTTSRFGRLGTCPFLNRKSRDELALISGNTDVPCSVRSGQWY